jgi:hypothetical protein
VRPFSLGFGGGCMHKTLRGSFPFDSPPKSLSKGAQFWGFLLSMLEAFLV